MVPTEHPYPGERPAVAAGPTRADPVDAEAALITHDMCEAAPGAAGTGRADGRADFERGMSYAPPLTLALIVVNVAVFGWQLATGALESREAVVAAGALHRDRVLAGEVWRLLTAAFLHGSVDHLLGNCLVLWIVGMACEHAVGLARTGLIYLGSALAGSALSLAIEPGPSVGASGAVFGVTAAVVVFLWRYQRRFVVRDKRTAGVLGLWGLYQLGIGLLTPYVDNAAHLGGLVGGAALVLLAKPRLAAPV